MSSKIYKQSKYDKIRQAFGLAMTRRPDSWDQVISRKKGKKGTNLDDDEMQTQDYKTMKNEQNTSSGRLSSEEDLDGMSER